MLCLMASPSSALPILNAGETFTFEFGTLPALGPGSVQTFQAPGWTPPASIAELFWQAWPLDPGAQLHVKVFEDSLSDTPLADFTWTDTLSGGFMFGLTDTNALTDVWKDLQGAFSMTAISGSAYVSSIDLLVAIRTSDWVDYTFTTNRYGQRLTFGSSIEVPDNAPGTAPLAAIFAGILWLSARRPRNGT
jgi:hypothetical protein